MLRFSVLSHPAVFLGYKQLCIVNQTSNIGLQGLKTNRVINLNHGTVGLANLCRVSSLASLLFSVLSTEHVSEVMVYRPPRLTPWRPRRRRDNRDNNETQARAKTTTTRRKRPMATGFKFSRVHKFVPAVFPKILTEKPLSIAASSDHIRRHGFENYKVGRCIGS